MVKNFKPSQTVDCVAYAPDGKQFFTGDRRGQVSTYSSAGDLLKVAKPDGVPHTIRSLLVTPDGTTIVTQNQSHVTQFWNTKTGAKIREFNGPPFCYDIGLARNNRIVYRSAKGGPVQVWDLRSGQRLRQFGDPPSDEGMRDTRRLAVSPDGKRALVEVENGDIQLYDLDRGLKITTLNGHKGNVYTMAFSSDGRFAISGGWDGFAHVGNCLMARRSRRLPHPEGIPTDCRRSMPTRSNCPRPPSWSPSSTCPLEYRSTSKASSRA
ncbi:hypothetical protein AYO40_04775 [Planctomycetaceae bacterium SCGC AG-212-D15]|nr:hypothetical protein AYO40_04775 [Planctomycetaceae bacterium SCGC AG-212-D15]